MIWAAPAITNHNQLVTDNQILLRGIQANKLTSDSGDVLTPKDHSRFINATHTNVHIRTARTDAEADCYPGPGIPLNYISISNP